MRNIWSSSSTFHVAIRNPVYCGKAVIEKYDEEEAHLVRDQHKPLISGYLFYKKAAVNNNRS
ncbi:recombinase family protein [Flavobacterium sp. RHBU_24]|uniref:recombinase family protein n=1 Tax=Flavobacterium sp. RHBU_24 TaxID=3391185 RepID=UPI003984D35A